MTAAPCARCGAVVAVAGAPCPACLLAVDEEPLVAGRYRLQGELGRGASATVFRAHDEHLDRSVALKVLDAEPEDRGLARQRFEQEARLLARLRHPALVVVHDYGVAALPFEEVERPFLVMELLDGGSLAGLGPVAPERAVAIVRALAGALALAHAAGIVHRDVKPENVLLASDGSVRLADFGIARSLDAGAERWTASRTVVGTPHYVAPEVLAGTRATPAADVWALGVLLYELVAGRLPIGDVAPLKDPRLDAVVRRALAHEPARRWPDGHALAEALEELDHGLRPAARGRDAVAASVPRLEPDERAWFWGAVAIHAIANAVVIWAVLVSITPRVHPAGAELPLVALDIAALPDGRRVSYARFETWPTLLAVLAGAIALGVHGAVRRHWRLSGLLARGATPAGRLPWARATLVTGLFACALYGLRLVLEVGGARGFRTYVPVVGGIVELAGLIVGWAAMLEASRLGRRPWRELELVAGVFLMLACPVTELGLFLRTWSPP